MHTRNLVLLALLVALLSGVVYWSNNQVVAYQEELFPGVTRPDVVGIFVDNVERDVQVRIERNEDGAWSLIDPIAVPADEALISTLMDVIEQDHLRLVPGDPDPKVFGFDPPRIVFQITTEDGEKHRAEVGAVDSAQNSVHIRVRDKIYRGALRINTELTRDLHGYRRPYAFRIKPESIGELHRTGAATAGEHRFGFEMHALLDNDGWRLVSPFAAGLHPGPMSLFVTNGVRIPIRSHLSKNANHERLGLEPARFTLVMTEIGGTEHELRLGPAGGNRSVVGSVGADGDPFMTDADSARRLEIPLELLLDRRVLRVSRELLDDITLVRADQPDLVFTRQADHWTVAIAGETARPVDPVRFEHYLADLEAQLFYDILEVGELTNEEVHSKLRFRAAGESWELRFGAKRDDEGVSCYRVQQAGDGILGLFEVAEARFLDASATELRDHRLTRIDELSVRAVSFEQGDRTRRWTRDDKGLWTREGKTEEAWEVLGLLDPLFHLRAASFEPADESAPATPAEQVLIRVEFAQGEPSVLVLERRDGTLGLVRDGEFAPLAPDQQSLFDTIVAVLSAE